ncbi:MAG TPA: GNAT family N-acetyltransferase [Stellaceae bacterium]|nr:GNAT family N-acetyltransferase [Stellaceae bacterium]
MRGNLKRQIEYFSRASGGLIDFRQCQSDEEMADFFKHAGTISRLKRQRNVSWDFSDFDGRICGFLLLINNDPIAYALCTIEDEILIYQYTEYNPNYSRFSPGTTLFLLIIKKILSDFRVNFVDIGANTTWKYKKSFATGSVEYMTVLWFPKSLKNVMMVIVHWFILNLWKTAAGLKNILR